MRGVNRVIIVGNTGNDPEVQQLQNGGGVATISVATSEQWSDKQTGEKREATEWHRIKAFGKLAEIIAQYVKKGTPVYIEGKLKTDKYTDKNGIERYITYIVADQMQMLGGKQNNGQQNNAQQQFGDNPFMHGQAGNGVQFMQSNAQNPTIPQGMQQPKPSAVDDSIPF